MKQGKTEFSEEQFWTNVKDGVKNYVDDLGGGDKKRRKRYLDNVRTVYWVECLAKVVNIRPLQNVTSENCARYYAFAQQQLKEVIAADDANKMDIKPFDKISRQPKRAFTDTRLEIDIEGKNSCQPGTIAVCMGAAIDLVNYVNTKSSSKNFKRLKLESHSDDISHRKNLILESDAKSPPSDLVPDHHENLSEEEQHLLPFLKEYYNAAKNKSPDGELSQNLDWPYEPDHAVHKLTHTVYVTPPLNLADADKIVFGNRLREAVFRKMTFREKIQRTLVVKTEPTTNYEVKRPNTPGVFRADLANQQYPLGTLLLTRGALIRLANYYRSHFKQTQALQTPVKPLPANKAQNKRLSLEWIHHQKPQSTPTQVPETPVNPTPVNQAQRKTLSLENLADFAHPEDEQDKEPQGKLNQADSEAQKLAQKDNQPDTAAQELTQKDNKPDPTAQESVQKTQQPETRGQDHHGEEEIIILTSSDEDDEAFQQEFRRLSNTNASLLSALAEKEKQANDLESKVGKEKTEYQKLIEERKAQKRAEQDAKLQALREEQKKLADKQAELDKRIEQRTQEHEALEVKIAARKKVKVASLFEDPSRVQALLRVAAPAASPAAAVASSKVDTQPTLETASADPKLLAGTDKPEEERKEADQAGNRPI